MYKIDARCSDGSEKALTIFCCPHCSRLLTVLNSIVTPDSGSTMFNVVNSLEQCRQQNIVQYCFHQLGTSCHERLAQLAKYFSKLEHGLVRSLGKYSRPSNGKKSVL